MERNLLAISVKLGLSDGSVDQHCSINDLHSGSQYSGTCGRSLLLTIPPLEKKHNKNIEKVIISMLVDEKKFASIFVTLYNSSRRNYIWKR